MHRKRSFTQRNSQPPPNFGDSVGGHGASSWADLAVEGRACPLIDLAELPADVAQDMIDRGTNVQLLACHGELVDRFDVRHLLDALPPVDDDELAVDISHDVAAIFETSQVIEVASGDVSVTVLDQERYWALASDQCGDTRHDGHDLQSRHSCSGSDSSSSDEGEANAGASFPSKRSRIPPRPAAPDWPKPAASEPSSALGAAPTGPPRVHVQPILLTDPHRNSQPPLDPKLAEIIRRTATFIRTHADPPSAEHLLKSKQGANPQFAFLHAADANHGYFQSLARRDADDERMDAIKATAKAVARQGDAMVQLLVERNRGDPRFAFLSPWHRLHTTFRAYVSKEALEMQAVAVAVSSRELLVAEVAEKTGEMDATQWGDEQAGSAAQEHPVVVSSARKSSGLVAYSSESDED